MYYSTIYIKNILKMRKIKLTEAQLKYCIAHSLKESDVTLVVGPEDKEKSGPIATGVNALERGGVNVNVVPEKNPSTTGQKTTSASIAKTAQAAAMMESFSKKDFERMRKGKK